MAYSQYCAEPWNGSPGTQLIRVTPIAFAIALSFGCEHAKDDGRESDSPNSLMESLHKGDAALQSMQKAAVRRDYDKYFRQYAVLRDCYIEVAASFRPDQPDDRIVLETLDNWESMIQVARNAWREMDVPETQLTPDTEQMAASADWPEIQARIQKLQSLNEKSHKQWEKTNAEWAPIEARLDKAMETIHSQE